MDDNPGYLTGHLVNTLLHGLTFNHIAVFDFTTHLRHNGNGEGIPIRNHGARVHLGTICNLKFSPVGNREPLAIYTLII